jgi:hypothetical protein
MRILLSILLAFGITVGYCQPDTVHTAYIYVNDFSSLDTTAGQAYLNTSAKVYYSFLALRGGHGATIANGNIGLVDYGPGSFTATVLSSPTIDNITYGDSVHVNTLGATGVNAITTGQNGAGWFDEDFQAHMALKVYDGIPSGTVYASGNVSTAGTTIFTISLNTSGILQIRFRTPTADSRWDSAAPVFLNGENPLHGLQISYDFTNDVFGIWLDGNAISGSFASGSMAALDPSTWSSTQNFAIGSANLQGTINNNPAAISIVGFAVTDITTAQERADILAHLTTPPLWTVNEVAGFTYEVVDDTLVTSGYPLGFQDWISHNDWTVTMEEFDIGDVVILDSIDTNSTGTGIGIKNDLDTEANRGVLGLFITDTNSANFGKVQIYSGTGSVSPTAFNLRSTSSGALPIEQDDTVELVLHRELQGNDAFYSFTATDTDSVSVTVGYTETGRPSSAFYGISQRAYIYQNAGGFKINPFYAYRRGVQTSPSEPPPPTGTYAVHVQLSGSDAADCSESTPCRTNVRGLERVGEIGTASTDMFTGPGTFTEGSFLNPPTNLGDWDGAGKNVTFINGTSNLYTSTSTSGRDNLNRFFVSLISTSPTTVTTRIRHMTFSGNKNIGGTVNSIKGCFAIRRRNGVELSDIVMRNFNTSGLRMWDVDVFTMDNFLVERCSGTETSYTHYQIETGSATQGGVGGCGGVTLISSDEPEPGDTYNINVTNGVINAPEFGEGAGWGTKGGTGGSRYFHNTKIQNVVFNVVGTSQDDEGHHFNLEWLDVNPGHILVDNVFFNANISFGLTGVAATHGYTRITNSTFDFDDPTNITFVAEMQISKIVIDHNFVVNARSGVFESLNNQNTYKGGESGGSPFAQDHGDWWIHHNILQLTTGASFAGIFGGLTWDTDDQIFEQNTIRFLTTSGGLWFGNVVSNQAGHSVSGLVIQNNAYINQPPPSSNMWDTGTISGGISRNNKSTHFNVTASRAGVTVTNSQIHGAGNTLGLGLGTPPTTWAEAFNDDYYRPKISLDSELIDNGFGGVTIGALEED